MAEVGDAEEEADGVEDVGLAGAVEAGDGVKLGVEAGDLGALAVRLEAVDHHALDEHLDLTAVDAVVGGRTIYQIQNYKIL